MLRATTVVMCKTCHGDKVHFLAIQFEDLSNGEESWMNSPPSELGRMCMAQSEVMVVYAQCNIMKSPS